MLTKTHITLYIFFTLSLFLRPPYTVAQTGESFKGNTGGFTPSTIIIIIIALIFMVTGFLAIFLRQFSDGCFGLNVQSINSGVTADGRLVARGLHADVIKSFPTYLYSDVKQHRLGKVELECAVCLCEFQDSEALRLLPVCSHVFHPRCIDLWLASHVTCPICRQTLEVGSDVLKPCAIINIPQIQNEPITIDPDHDHDNHESTADDDQRLVNDDHDEEKEMKKIVGKFPRSHSTGHSLADSERFTLRLPEDVQSNLVNRSKYDDETLPSMVSPRCGWFSMTPPNFGPIRSSSVIISGSKNTRLPIKTSDRLWPI